MKYICRKVTLHECNYNVLSWSKSGDYKEKQVDEKYRKGIVTAHVVLRTATMFLDSALNRGNHSPEIFSIVTITGGRLLLRAQANNMAPNQRNAPKCAHSRK